MTATASRGGRTALAPTITKTFNVTRSDIQGGNAQLTMHRNILHGYEVYCVIHSLPLEVRSVNLISDFRNCGRMGLISVTNEFHLISIYTLECD